jgi:hypothetical protein
MMQPMISPPVLPCYLIIPSLLCPSHLLTRSQLLTPV